eukprot:3562775-Prymnesium_polylepis.1
MVIRYTHRTRLVGVPLAAPGAGMRIGRRPCQGSDATEDTGQPGVAPVGVPRSYRSNGSHATVKRKARQSPAHRGDVPQPR